MYRFLFERKYLEIDEMISSNNITVETFCTTAVIVNTHTESIALMYAKGILAFDIADSHLIIYHNEWIPVREGLV